MKILVTGGKGQLGSELRELSGGYGQYRMTFIDIQDIDLTNRKAVDSFLEDHSFDGIINCAAYTAVDKAETEPGPASRLNEVVPGQLADKTAKSGQWMIHISTDYVFDGKNYRPYLETDPANPVSVYGKTKLAGEKAVLSSGAGGLIIRTSWLYSGYNTNFARTIYVKGREKGELNVVQDQVGSPTNARDLAKTILDIIPELDKNSGMEIYHYSNEGVASWYDFAKAVVNFGNIDCRIHPIDTKDFPTLAVRPSYSVLNKAKIRERFGIIIPYWMESLGECIRKTGISWQQ